MRILFAILITTFWASMMALLVRKEIFPGEYTDQGFQSTAPERLQPSKSRMGIYFGDRRIGATDTKIMPLADGSVNIISVTNIELELLRKQKCAVRLSIQLDPNHSLRHFRMDVQWPLGETSVRGYVLGNQLEITTAIPQGERKHIVPFDSQAIVSSSMSPLMVMPRLSVGRRWRLKTWNPLNMQMEPVVVEVKEKTTLEWEGKGREVFLLEVAHANLTCKAWVTLDGELLQEELPLGRASLILRKEIPSADND